MLIAFMRKLGLTLIILCVLSLISYNILLRDPLNFSEEVNVFEGYFRYLSSLLRADLGISYTNGEPLTAQILAVFPATITLCVVALCFFARFRLAPWFCGGLYSQKHIGENAHIDRFA